MLSKTVILCLISFCFIVLFALSTTSTTPVPNPKPLFDIKQLNCTLGQTSTPLFCNWTSSNNSAWLQGETGHCFKNVNITGPAGPPIFNGHYIKANITPSNSYNSNADILSPILKPKETTDCFSFNYYIDKSGAKEISLYLLKHNKYLNSSQTVWSRHYSAGDFWHLNRVVIGPQDTNYQLKFVVSPGSGEVALAYIQVTPGICPSYSCDFESTSCNWTTTYTNENYQFKLKQANDFYSASQDHTTENIYGHFMSAEQDVSGNTGDSTSLVSPLINLTSNYCLQFWYWSYNSMVSRIDVMTNGSASLSSHWNSSSNFANKTWHRAQVSLNMTGRTQIIIKSTKLNNQTKHLNIDDISLIEGNCQEPISCNFNKDLCGWTRDMSLDWIWDQGIGRIENGTVIQDVIDLAPEDRLDPSAGMYMYTDFSLLRSYERMANMKLQSEYVQATKGSCLSFYYMPVSINDTSANFEVVLYNVQGNVISTLFKYSSKSIINSEAFLNWTQITIDIRSSSTFRIVFNVSSKVPRTYLAIDDVVYRTGSCHQSTTSKTIFNTLTTPT